MTNPYILHPNEEALERFLLRRSDDQELETVETHILACDSCVARLEALEMQLADLKTSLALSEEERLRAAFNPKVSAWKKWFTVPNLSWAGAACAALAVALVVVPGRWNSDQSNHAAEGALSACAASDVNLAACRGTQTPVLPSNRPLDIRLDTTDITAGPVDAQLVNGMGRELWQGQGTVQNQRAELKVSRITEPGTYFLRLYAPGASTEHELLREYRFTVK
jgi:hypothetical protein